MAISSLGMGANLLDLLLVVFRCDSSLDQGDINLIGEVLGIHEGTVDHVDQLRQFEDPFVHVEERHMTAGTSIEPHRCHFQFAHCASLMRFR